MKAKVHLHDPLVDLGCLGDLARPAGFPSGRLAHRGLGQPLAVVHGEDGRAIGTPPAMPAQALAVGRDVLAFAKENDRNKYKWLY